MNFFTIFMILCLAQRACCNTKLRLTRSAKDVFDVTTYGAVGDGKVDDSQAFLKAWSDLCGATSSNPTMIVPAGKTFLLQTVAFEGPCKSSSVHVQVFGNIVAPNQISAWTGRKDTWLIFSHVDGLIVDGSGQIDGQGSVWWSSCKSIESQEANACDTRPTALKFQGCNNLRLSGLSHINSPRNHVSISGCNNVTVSSVHVIAPEDSPNTDGFDISHSSQVVIKDSFIGTGDDCVAINTGCSFINITNVACGPGHGISVGSLGAHGEQAMVEEIHVQNCNFTKTQNAARIKTWQGGSGYARKISFDQITLVEAGNPIIIDQFYFCDGIQNCREQASAVKISDVSFTRFQGTSITDEPINLHCSDTVPCTNIMMDYVNIQSASRKTHIHSFCKNVQGKAVATSPVVSCLSS